MEFKQLGQTIRTIRKKQGLTQEQLGQKTGVTWEMVSRYERGLSSALPRLEDIGKALKTNPAEIYAMAYNITLADDIDSSKIPTVSSTTKELLNKTQNSKDFIKNCSNGYSYATPKWITDLDKDSFIIEPKAFGTKPEVFKDSKEFIISPNSSIKKNDYVLQIKNGNLLLTKTPDKDGITLGVLIANQQRYR
jgi:transcriptional regulator with XRE-family HTH domain